ncbi:MAG: hypothetical protein AB1458_13170 [Bacteroidota bacterium]
MKNIFFITTIFLALAAAHGQTGINQFDQNDKKHGKWLEYLDAKWKVLNDSSHAVYCAYNYYEHGQNTFRISFGKEYRLRDKLEITNNDNRAIGKLKLLHGEYKWFDKKGRIVSIDHFENGEHIWSKMYFWERGQGYWGFYKRMTGKLGAYYDFTKMYQNQPNTYYMEVYDKSGNITYYFTRKVNHWGAYPISKDELDKLSAK